MLRRLVTTSASFAQIDPEDIAEWLSNEMGNLHSNWQLPSSFIEVATVKLYIN